MSIELRVNEELDSSFYNLGSIDAATVHSAKMHMQEACKFSQYLVADSADSTKYDNVGFTVYNCQMFGAVQDTKDFVRKNTPEEGLCFIQGMAGLCRRSLADKKIQSLAKGTFLSAEKVGLFGSSDDRLIGYLTELETSGTLQTLAQKIKSENHPKSLLGDTFWNGADKVMSVLKSSLSIMKAAGMVTTVACVANPIAAGYLIKQYQAGMPLTSLALRAGVLGLNTIAAGGSFFMGQLSDSLSGTGRDGESTFEGTCFKTAAAGMFFGLPAYWLLKS